MKKSVIQAEINQARLHIQTIKNPEEAESVKSFIYGLLKSFEAQKLSFQSCFKMSELMIEADRKLWHYLSKGRLRDEDIAKRLGRSKGALHQLRSELKRAYDRPEGDIEALKSKALKAGRVLSRDFFIKSKIPPS